MSTTLSENEQYIFSHAHSINNWLCPSSHFNYIPTTCNIKKLQEKKVQNEIVFLVEQEADGVYTARSEDGTIFTEGNNKVSLEENIKDAISCHFDDQEATKKTYKLQFLK